MPQFRVQCQDQAGKPYVLKVDGDDEGHASRRATKAGHTVLQVIGLEPPITPTLTPVPAPPAATPPATTPAAPQPTWYWYHDAQVAERVIAKGVYSGVLRIFFIFLVLIAILVGFVILLSVAMPRR